LPCSVSSRLVGHHGSPQRAPRRKAGAQREAHAAHAAAVREPHSHHHARTAAVFSLPKPILGTLAIAITTLLLFFAHFVLTDLDNPFEGSWNVSAEPFAELVSKSR
jgi:hypothetical protein